MPETQSDILYECLRSMIRPVMRFCLRRSIKSRKILEACKQVLVELAVEDISEAGNQISVSRISVVTGIDRREVKRIYELGNPPKRSPDSVSLRVITQWQHNPNFQTKSGKPRTLQAEGRNSEFGELVRQVSGNLAPYTVLYELERIGAIKRTSKGLKLIKGGIVPQGDVQQSVQMMAADTNDMMAAIEENIAEVNPIPNYHLVTEFNNIDIEAIPGIRKWFLKEGGKFHKSVRRFLASYDLDLNPALSGARGGTKVMFGGFSRVTPTQQQIE